MERIFSKKLSEETMEYCFYMAVKNEFGGKSWSEWDEDIRLRKEGAVRHYRKSCKMKFCFYAFCSMFSRSSGSRLKKYANSRGIRIIGDIPIYVAFDGADSWAHSGAVSV